MSTLPFRYPLDPTGVSPDNRVAGEAHALPNRTVRAIAPLYGAFFAESLIIRDLTTNQILNTSQYKSTELFEFPTARYGKEICGIILITDTSVSSNISIDYQTLGGEYSTNSDAIVQMLNSIEFDNRPVAWPDIIGKPDAFEPAFHYHDIGDVYGFEYVVHAIERVRTAILVGDSSTHDAIYRYIDQQDQTYASQVVAVQQGLNAHTSNTNNPHQTTKAQVGLGSVDNFATATTAEAQAGAVNNKFMTPLRVAEAINAQAGQMIASHVNNTNNPHQTNKGHVGLGNVQNYGVASQTEAEQGSLNTVYMTPQRTAQAIAIQALVPLQNFAARTDNPHQVNKAQVGLGNVPNYTTSSSSQAVSGGSDSFMTPASSAVLLATHTNRGDNPHGTTAGQVGAYTTAQTDQVVAAHANRTDNPHNVTKAQVGLGNVSNFITATPAETAQGNRNDAFVTPAGVKAALAAAAPHGLAQAAAVRFMGRESNGPCDITTSYNVSSVVRVSEGNYQVTFATPLSSPNYLAIGTAQEPLAQGRWAWVTATKGGSETIVGCTIIVADNNANSYKDPYYCSYMFFN